MVSGARPPSRSRESSGTKGAQTSSLRVPALTYLTWSFRLFSKLALREAISFLAMGMLLASCGQTHGGRQETPSDELVERLYREAAVSTPIRPTPGPLTRVEVTQVIAGDTIEVSFNDGSLAIVRYAGISIASPRDAGWFGEPCLSTDATSLNRALVEAAPVYLEQEVTDVDSDGRLPRYVYLESGEMVNLRLIQEGYAITTAQKPDAKYQWAFRSDQATAHVLGRGIWRVCPPPSPIPKPTTP